MTKIDIDKLNVGDVVKCRAYSVLDEEEVVVKATIIDTWETPDNEYTIYVEFPLDNGYYRAVLNNQDIVD